MKLRNKILSGYLVLILCIVIIGIIGYSSNQVVKSEFKNINEEVIPKLGVVDVIKSAIAGQANDERGFLLTGDDKFAKEIFEKAETVDKSIEKFMEKANDDEKESIEQIEKIHLEFVAIQKQVIAAYQKGDISEAKRLSFEVGRNKRKELDPLYKKLQEQINEDLKTADASLEGDLHRTTLITVVLSMGAARV